MKRLFAAAGVDYVQWRALSPIHLHLDYSALLGASGASAAWRAARTLLVMGLFYGFMGGLSAVVIWLARDTFFAATVMTTMEALLVGTMTLLQGAWMVVPEDYGIVGFLPISSRTYFAVRATTVFVQTCEIAVLTGYLPVIAFLTRSGGSWRLAGAAAFAIGASAATVMSALIAACGLLLGLVPPSRLRRAISYGGALGMLLWVGGLTLMLYHVIDAAFSNSTGEISLVLPHRAWILCYPAVWFASYVEIAQGVAGRFETTAGALSVLLLVTVVAALRGRLSSDYAARVSQAMDATESPRTPMHTWMFLRGEARAIVILARNQLRADLMFHMNVVMTVGMIAFIVWSDHSQGVALPGALDPFRNHAAGLAGGSMLAFIAVYTPMSLHNTLARSAEWEASWIFFATPSDRATIVCAMRDVVAAVILAPLLVVIAMWCAYAFGHAGHALLHTLFLGLVGYCALELDTLLRPTLPFSLPAGPGQRPQFMSGRSMAVNLAGMAMAFFCQLVLYRTWAGILLGLAALAGLALALNRLTRARIGQRLA